MKIKYGRSISGGRNGLQAIRLFAALALAWLLAIIVLSGYEWLVNRTSQGAGEGGGSLLFYKWFNDLLFWLGMYLWILIPFLIAGFFSIRLAKWLCISLIVLLVLIHAMLIKYFSTALVMLGADLYSYSWKDIKQTVGASGGMSIGGLMVFLVLIALLIVSLLWSARHIRIPVVMALLLPVLSLVAILAGPGTLALHGRFDSDFSSSLVLNKPDYFFHQSWAHFFPVENDVDIYADYYIAEEETKAAGAGSFRYPDEGTYPFFHDDSTKDVLTPFFNKDQKPPNIVILLVEGLGRAFTNEGAYLGNFTPFIDSLAGQSLYWKNFLSEGGRTFAVLPSVLGSLPFGKNGFLEMGSQMPPDLSLINILKKNGYRTSFYYGGDARFDNMDIFLQKNGIDELNDGRTFPPGYTKLPANNGFSWGYNDKELFRRYLDTRMAKETPAQLSIILTVSTHSPFRINEQDKYFQLFENRMDQLGFDKAEKEEHRDFKSQYASILYTDDALRYFFAAYAKRPDYKNTIFLITGDHRMPEIPMRTKIDRYHVPLIVYSPLLKRRADFLSVSTHFDITPSLLAWLDHSYGLRRPLASQWMGSGLDTARGFRNIHAYPIMQTKTDLVDFILGDYHLNGTRLFRLSYDMNEQPVADDAEKDRLNNAFERFLRQNAKLAAGAKLIPDSLNRY